jgi:hypothetical protein
LTMKTKMKSNYDCVGAVRKERERIARETQGKSPNEIIEYFSSKRKRTANKQV